MVAAYGADTLRLYTLSVAPPEDALEWNDKNVSGVHRFLHRVWGLLDRHAGTIRSETRSPVPAELSPAARALRRKVHQTIRRITDDVEERLKLNTAVSALIELENAIADAEKALAETREGPVFREALETLVLLLSPFAPTSGRSVGAPGPASASWTGPGRSRMRASPEDEVELAVQVNGKVRGRITVPAEARRTMKRKRWPTPRWRSTPRARKSSRWSWCRGGWSAWW
jgi:leucyl-tRNA synthetase